MPLRSSNICLNTQLLFRSEPALFKGREVFYNPDLYNFLMVSDQLLMVPDKGMSQLCGLLAVFTRFSAAFRHVQLCSSSHEISYCCSFFFFLLFSFASTTLTLSVQLVLT